MSRARLLDFMRQKVYRPLTPEELVASIMEPGERKADWMQLLAELENEAAVIRTRHGRLGLPEQMNLVVGTVQAQSQGYAFVIPEDKAQKGDVYIPAHATLGAMHKDRVLVRVVRQAKGETRAEGEIIRVLARAFARVVGRFEGFPGEAGYVIPDEKRLTMDIVIPLGKGGTATSGDKVVAELRRWPKDRQPAEGEVVEVLGRAGEPSVESLAVVRQMGLPEEFPSEVHAEVARIPLSVTPEQRQGRRDLTGLNMVTIDGADAKDLDDAVSIERTTDGLYRLGVHIADVGHYVREGTPLDREAFERGTSVYLADGVIPMLPEVLSNGICSLNPQVERLALSVFMDVNAEGEVVNHEIVESVIRTAERMTYNSVNAILTDKPGEIMERYTNQVKALKLMRSLRDILMAKREKRGSIDFELGESKIILDEEGSVLDIVPREKTLADSIIEEFMVLANETVATRFFGLEVPFMYRVHEEPALDKIADLNIFLNSFGLRVRSSKEGVKPRAIQEVMLQLEGKPEKRLVHRVLLRHMMRARYSPEALGHFGLASQYYSHFTSPIRRYPDLVIHRIIKRLLHQSKLSEKDHQALTALVAEAATQSSDREQLATEAERAVEGIKKALFMQDKVGEEYDGFISGVVSFGFFVELGNTVEGLVHISTLDDDYYDFDPDTYALYGRRTKRRLRLGDPIKVRVEKVSTTDWTIDFSLVEGGGPVVEDGQAPVRKRRPLDRAARRK
ncbi:MAG TPA: ribonuclease R [Bacillota bacterium]|nr:ribonuclease R [Bacillota bacterium]